MKQQVRGNLHINPQKLSVMRVSSVSGTGDGRLEKRSIEVSVWDEDLRVAVVLPNPEEIAAELADAIEWLRGRQEVVA